MIHGGRAPRARRTAPEPPSRDREHVATLRALQARPERSLSTGERNLLELLTDLYGWRLTTRQRRYRL
jgi:hypothetical protein